MVFNNLDEISVFWDTASIKLKLNKEYYKNTVILCELRKEHQFFFEVYFKLISNRIHSLPPNVHTTVTNLGTDNINNISIFLFLIGSYHFVQKSFP